MKKSKLVAFVITGTCYENKKTLYHIYFVHNIGETHQDSFASDLKYWFWDSFDLQKSLDEL